MKEAVGLKKEVDTALNNLEGVIQTAKDKVQNSSTYLQVQLGEFFLEYSVEGSCQS